MIRCIALCLSLFCAAPVLADSRAAIVRDVVAGHILPGYRALADRTAMLSAQADDCRTSRDGLRAAYHAAFDAWMAVSHLRFGPSEVNDRAYSVAFWPDSKGFTPKTLMRLIADEDAAVNDPAVFAEISIAGRGLFALDFVLFDPQFAQAGSDTYRCALIAAIAADLQAQSDAILTDWTQGYAAALTGPSAPYRSTEEAAQELFRALSAGLEFTSENRLGRPMGRWDKPRPRRAEARRSARSQRNVELSLIALRDLSARLAADAPDLADALDRQFAQATAQAAELGDPDFAGVATPQGRIRVEALKTRIDKIRDLVATELGPHLGVSAGFNSLDGD